MPRTLKRRSDQISRDNHRRVNESEEEDEDEDEDEEQIRPGPSHRNRAPPVQRQKGKQRQQPANTNDEDDEDEEADQDEDGDESDDEDNYTAANANTRNNRTIDDLVAEVQEGRTQSQTSILVKKLVRLALATEYSRTPLRRTDITAKVFKDTSAAGGTTAGIQNGTQSMSSAKNFKTVFSGAQRVLQGTFGMQLVELPSREKTSLKDRRNQAAQNVNATQTQARRPQSNGENTQPAGPGANSSFNASSSSSKSWILVSTLPKAYKDHPGIITPAKAPSQDIEASYTALYTFILSLIYLNNSALPEPKLERYLKRVNAESYTPLGPLDRVLARMVKEGYIEKRRDTSTGEEVVEWVVGPRGKVEIGTKGVVGLVRKVYGVGVAGPRRDGQDNPMIKEDEEELNARLSRSLGINVSNTAARDREESDEDDRRAPQAEPAGSTTDGGTARNESRNQERSRRTTQQPPPGRAQALPSRGRAGRRTGRNNNHDDDNDEDDE